MSTEKKSKGRQRIPDAKRRTLVSVRVLPETLAHLESMGHENVGRAIDALVAQIKHGDKHDLGSIKPVNGILAI